MQAKYGEKARLLFTDTDSLMYEVETEDVYADMVKEQALYDFSNYAPSNPYYKRNFKDNKAKLGLMKDEAAGHPITEYVGLRAKMYSFEEGEPKADGTLEITNHHRAKGIQRAQAARFTHQQYLDQLHHPEENYVINRRLGSRLHKIYGIEVGFSIIFIFRIIQDVNSEICKALLQFTIPSEI